MFDYVSAYICITAIQQHMHLCKGYQMRLNVSFALGGQIIYQPTFGLHVSNH